MNKEICSKMYSLKVALNKGLQHQMLISNKDVATSEKRFFIIKINTNDSNNGVEFSTIDDIINFYSNKRSLQSKVDVLNNLKNHTSTEREGIS